MPTVPPRSRWRLACFDLDGTLIRHTTSGQFLAEKIGHAAEMAEIERRYAQGLVSNAEVAALDGRYYRGLSRADVERLLEDVPLMGGIAETVGQLAQRGIPSLVCTLAWAFVAEVIAKRFGFVGWSGPSLAVADDGRFTGAVLADFLDTDKPVFVERYCQQQGIAMRDVFHVGDSRSDVALFQAVGFSVALNGNELARTHATVAVDSESLLDVLAVIPGLLG